MSLNGSPDTNIINARESIDVDPILIRNIPFAILKYFIRVR